MTNLFEHHQNHFYAFAEFSSYLITPVKCHRETSGLNKKMVLPYADFPVYDKTTVLPYADFLVYHKTTVLPYADFPVYHKTTVLPYADFSVYDKTTVLSYADFPVYDKTMVLPYADFSVYDPKKRHVYNKSNQFNSYFTFKHLKNN